MGVILITYKSWEPILQVKGWCWLMISLIKGRLSDILGTAPQKKKTWNLKAWPPVAKRQVAFIQEITNRTQDPLNGPRLETWVSNSSSNLLRDPLVRSHLIFDGIYKNVFVVPSKFSEKKTLGKGERHQKKTPILLGCHLHFVEGLSLPLNFPTNKRRHAVMPGLNHRVLLFNLLRRNRVGRSRNRWTAFKTLFLDMNSLFVGS